MLSPSDFAEIAQIAKIIKGGGVVIFPTETVYALACDIRNIKAAERIRKIKDREDKKPFSVLCQNYEQMQNYVHTSKYNELIQNHIPGPITFVLPYNEQANLQKTQVLKDSLGVRVPDHEVAQEILNKVGSPIIATSVNFTGEDPAKNYNEIPTDIVKQVDYILKGDDNSRIGVASTVVDLTCDTPQILRQGTAKFNFI